MDVSELLNESDNPLRLDHDYNTLKDTPMNYTAEFLQAALLEMNVKEIKGKNHNPRILQYHKATSLKASTDEVPWCSAFANFIVTKKCGVEGTNSALARSWENWGKLLEHPEPGCLVVFSRGSDPKFGHIAFYLYETASNIYVIGGNQGDAVSITPYRKSRLVCYRGI